MENNKNMSDRMFKVPENYFEDLERRLMGIPDAETKKVSPWTRVTPYLALAASFAAIVISATVILKSTAGSVRDSSVYEDYIELAALVPRTAPYSIYDKSFDEEEESTYDDVVEYLIHSGVSLESIGYIAENYE